MLINTYAFWLLLGIALLLSELFIPGLIAAFFGIGALLVGVLTLLGIIDTLAAQLAVFAVFSLVALFALRKHFHRWLRGTEADPSAKDMDDAGVIGSRVKVLTDFTDGTGTVQLNGAKWDAESPDSLKMGDTAWVTEHKGIILVVSATKP